jgi:hypothetical protein
LLTLVLLILTVINAPLSASVLRCYDAFQRPGQQR